MRATIKNYIDAAKQRREENGEGGFSLIELIVVVAILGILVAIAIPVFSGIQDSARENAAKTVASNAVTAVAAVVAQGDTPSDDTIKNLEGGNVTSVKVWVGATGLDSICAEAEVDGKKGYAGNVPSGGTCGTAAATVEAP